MSKVFLNDSIIDAAEAKVSANDGGFLYGMGLFETMRAVAGHVFRIDDHIDRLLNSSESLSINNCYERDFIKNAIAELLAANDLSDARIRLTLSGGSIAGDNPTPTLLITAVDFAPYPPEYFAKGVTVTLTDYRQNTMDPLCGHKTTNYFARLMALQQAHQKKSTEALWFTIDGKLAEGCVSNVFLVKDKIIYTPSLDTPVLPGIARKTVLEIAEKQSIEVVSKDLFIADLLAADEVFLTNSIMTVLPVSAIEAHTVGEGKPGDITKQILTGYNEMLAVP